MFYINSCFILTIISIISSSVGGETFHVSNFGADSNDKIDDTKAIQLAINTAISHGFNNTVVFNSGTYHLISTVEIFNATNLTIQGQGMDETLLIGTAPISIFLGRYCQGLTISLLSIDYYPRPFTAGYIVNVNNSYLDVEIQPPHEPDIDRRVHSIFRYDPIAMRPAFGPNVYQIYQKVPKYGNTSLISPGVLRIPLQFRTKFAVGDPIVATYFGQNHAIQLRYVTDGTIQSVTVYTSWYLSILTLRAKRLNIIDYHTRRRDGYWLSTNADCMHFTDSREYVSVLNTKCQSTGDDGLAVHAVYFLVTEVINSTTLMMQIFNWTDPLDVGDNTTLQFSSHTQPFTAYTKGTVASSISNSTNLRLFTFTSPINVNVGDWACVADSAMLIVQNYTVENNRGRGALLQTHNIDIRHSIFNRTSAPAILFQPSLFWHDGPPGRNATFAENLYINCNEGISQEKGIITFLPDPIQLVPVFDHIQIESSTFLFGNYSQGLIQSNNVNNLFISGNYIATNISGPIISICNSRNISANNNTIVNNEAKIDQYYRLDETNPCQINLTSLIDLPPSAFNSSFPPPVLLTSSSVQYNQDHFMRTND
jgi:hypothetical protein